MSNPGNLTNKTYELVEAWIHATDYLKSLRSQVNGAECAEHNALAAMAKFLTPENSKMNETFNIWVGDALLEIRCCDSERITFDAKWRDGKQPTKKL